ncbi:hypothetical protein [Aurantiacibacter sediminis]|uniref:Uncharacterized protein n=1 Tax=Aurantiacibacter sediminis TaxID=2793064 RepID=A0ABS0N645_9SPHN|nr:hypothetical protein [Aurantiacibacter sediminis]MBH5323251.1 hypothetical protein [Aurantiacibacter sediminis]
MAQPALAQTTEGSVTASNGVMLNVHNDKAQGMVEYAAPEVSFAIDGSTIESSAIVTRWGLRSDPGDAFVSFIVAYSGNYIGFDRATTAGGEELQTIVILQDDSGCQRAGSADCIFMEVFRVLPTPEQVSEAARDGMFPIRIVGSRGGPFTVEVPLSYFEAVNSR